MKSTFLVGIGISFLISIDWDEPLNKDLAEDWQKIVDDLQVALMTATNPRRYHLNSNSQSVPQLHCFADSSIKVYGAVANLKHGHEIHSLWLKLATPQLSSCSTTRVVGSINRC